MPDLHLVDATWELFRAYHAIPSIKAPDGLEVGAIFGALSSVLALLQEPGVTHAGCATDHVVRSWRNDAFAGYKTEEGVPEDLMAQFWPLEVGLRAMGVAVWPMVDFEADDAIATAVHRLAGDFDRILICAIDKDFAQLVRDPKVVLFDRRKNLYLDEAAVRAKFGVAPAAIPDWLALVGDIADGVPGLSGFGPKSAAAVLNAYGSIEGIPDDGQGWPVRGAARLAESLRTQRAEAALYKRLTTLSFDAPVTETADELRWQGPREPAWGEFCDRMGFKRLRERAGKAPAQT